ncbi:MAG TPA: hypothetical protein VGC19_14830 [Rhodanobacter sp.]
MSNTIELLELIGQNAALRHASVDELAHALEHAQASETLKAAIASGDSSLLCEELGHKPMAVPHTQGPGHEEDEPDHEKEHEKEYEEDPQDPATPDHDKPSLPS